MASVVPSDPEIIVLESFIDKIQSLYYFHTCHRLSSSSSSLTSLNISTYLLSKLRPHLTSYYNGYEQQQQKKNKSSFLEVFLRIFGMRFALSLGISILM